MRLESWMLSLLVMGRVIRCPRKGSIMKTQDPSLKFMTSKLSLESWKLSLWGEPESRVQGPGGRGQGRATTPPKRRPVRLPGPLFPTSSRLQVVIEKKTFRVYPVGLEGVMGKRGAPWKKVSNFYLLFRRKWGHTVLGNCVYHEALNQSEARFRTSHEVCFALLHGHEDTKMEMGLKLSADFADYAD